MLKKTLGLLILIILLAPIAVKAEIKYVCDYKIDGRNLYITKLGNSINYEFDDIQYDVYGNITSSDFVVSGDDVICPSIAVTFKDNNKIQVFKYGYDKIDLSKETIVMNGIFNVSNDWCYYTSSQVDIYITFNNIPEINYKCSSNMPDKFIYCDKVGRYKYSGNLNLSDFVTGSNTSNKVCPPIILQKYGENIFIYKYVDYTGMKTYNGTLIYQSNVKNTTTHTTTQDLFETNCADFASTIKIGGVILLLVKVMLPLIIIVKTSFSLWSVISKGTPDELKAKVNKMIISLIAAILIFFTPTIVDSTMDIITSIRGVSAKSSDMEICKACIFEPFSDKCNVDD